MLIWTKKEGIMKMLELYLSLIFDPNDTDLFEEIYYEYESYVFKVAKYYVKDHHYAEDASQIAFKNIALYMENLKTLSKDLYKPYIYRITKHASLLVIKKNTRNYSTVEYITKESGEDILEDYVDVDKLTRIKEYIKSMDEKYKSILSLYFQSDLNFREISEVLHIPKPTVKTRFYKAMDTLKEKFKEEDYD